MQLHLVTSVLLITAHMMWLGPAAAAAAAVQCPTDPGMLLPYISTYLAQKQLPVTPTILQQQQQHCLHTNLPEYISNASYSSTGLPDVAAASEGGSGRVLMQSAGSQATWIKQGRFVIIKNPDMPGVWLGCGWGRRGALKAIVVWVEVEAQLTSAVTVVSFSGDNDAPYQPQMSGIAETVSCPLGHCIQW